MTKPILTQAYLKECLSYDPETGVFTWLVRPRHHFDSDAAMNVTNGKFAGKIAGSLNDSGYVVINTAAFPRRAHRLAFLYMTGKYPEYTDHINHMRTDNRWCNLRDVSMATNNKNISLRKTNTAGYPGVTWHAETRKWRARFNKIHLGLFSLVEDAIAARKTAEIGSGFHQNHGSA